MTLKFAASTLGFYDDTFHALHEIPEDAVEISAGQREGINAAQSQGKMISADERGFPVLVDRDPLPPSDQIKAQIIALEAEITPRRLREAVLGTDGRWLEWQDAKISVLRAQL